MAFGCLNLNPRHLGYFDDHSSEGPWNAAGRLAEHGLIARLCQVKLLA